MKEKIKMIVVFGLGILVSSGVVYAATLYSATEVSYDNTSSGSGMTNVQSAIDELYEKANFSYVGTAQPEDVLEGKTFYNNSKILQTGTLKNIPVVETKSSVLNGSTDKQKNFILTIHDYGEPVILLSAYGYGVNQRYDDRGYMFLAVNFTIQASNDQSTWENLATTQVTQANNYNVNQVLVSSQTEKFRYYRCMIDFGNTDTTKKSAGFSTTILKN